MTDLNDELPALKRCCCKSLKMSGKAKRLFDQCQIGQIAGRPRRNRAAIRIVGGRVWGRSVEFFCFFNVPRPGLKMIRAGERLTLPGLLPAFKAITSSPWTQPCLFALKYLGSTCLTRCGSRPASGVSGSLVGQSSSPVFTAHSG